MISRIQQDRNGRYAEVQAREERLPLHRHVRKAVLSNDRFLILHFKNSFPKPLPSLPQQVARSNSQNSLLSMDMLIDATKYPNLSSFNPPQPTPNPQPPTSSYTYPSLPSPATSPSPIHTPRIPPQLGNSTSGYLSPSVQPRYTVMPPQTSPVVTPRTPQTMKVKTHILGVTGITPLLFIG